MNLQFQINAYLFEDGVQCSEVKFLFDDEISLGLKASIPVRIWQDEKVNYSIINLLAQEEAGLHVGVLDTLGWEQGAKGYILSMSESSESDKWWNDLLYDPML